MRKGIVLLFLAVIAAASSPHPQRRQLVRRQGVPVSKDTPPPVVSNTPPPASATPPATGTQPPANVPPATGSTPTPATTPATTPSPTPSPPASSPALPSGSPVASSPPVTNTSPSSPTDTQPTQPQQNTSAPPSADTPSTPVDTDTSAPSNSVTPPASGIQDPASSASQSATKKPDNDSGVGMGTIIGLSVAGGVAAIAIIGFIIWKLTRKRFPDFDTTDNTEAIKWPELNNNHAASTGDLSRAPSNAPSDPYAVPPLPQFNPNQPYRDDPNAGASGYYDPYRGPIPQTFQDDMGENIPMSTYPPSTRGRSPGPGMAYEMGGRGSPVPGRVITPMAGYDAGVGRTITPAPPGGPPYIPGAQPEMARFHSPGPNMYG